MSLEEKATFLQNNKDKIITNMSTIKYDLFLLLSNSENSEELVKKINKTLKKIDDKIVYMNIDVYYIIYTLMAFIDRLPGDANMKNESKANLFSYIEYFMDKEKEKNEYLDRKQLRISL